MNAIHYLTMFAVLMASGIGFAGFLLWLDYRLESKRLDLALAKNNLQLVKLVRATAPAPKAKGRRA